MSSIATSAQASRPIPIAVVTFCLCVNIAVAIWAVIARPSLNSDFRGLWSFAGFAHHRALTLIYQAAPMREFQQQLFPGFKSFFPLQYPPSFLLAIRWLGNFSYPAALGLWTLAGITSLVTASWIFFPLQLRWFAIAAMLAAPASLLNGVAGETGFFTAAILLAGFGLLPSRPLLAGFVLGLLTCKPQLGVLVPFALLARRDLKALLSAGATMLALVALSWTVFPASLWADWLQLLPVYQAQYLTAGKSLGLNAGVTLVSDLQKIGIPPRIAWLLQGTASFTAAAAIFLVFKRAPYPLAVAVLLAGTCLCAPHAFAYDAVQLTAAMLLLPSSALVSGLCLVIYLAPYLLLSGLSSFFFYAIPETLLFLHIIYLALHRPAHPDIRHEPISSIKHDPHRL